MFGTVVFKSRKGDYFFIRQAGQSADTFAHVSEFHGDASLLRVGAKVEFALGEHRGKKVARDVRLLEADIATPHVRAILGAGGAA